MLTEQSTTYSAAAISGIVQQSFPRYRQARSTVDAHRSGAIHIPADVGFPILRFPKNTMPTISQFFGIVIQMFWREHAPPQFHALYGEHEAPIDIRTLDVIVGRLPKRAFNVTIE